MSRLLLPFEPVYRVAMQRRRAANLARRESSQAPCPILSVGNLSVGGTGKTPTVQWAAKILQAQGKRVGIASRGYGGTLSDVGGLVSDGETVHLTTAQAGDEAVLHGQNLPGAIVAIAKDRHHAVDMAVQAGAEVVVLDDGFQFWSLPRAFDLVLLDARQPFDNGHLLPAGRLREDFGALERANAVLLTRADLATTNQTIFARREIRKWTQAPIFEASHAPLELRHEQSGEMWPLGWLRNRRIHALSAIADNDGFFASLKKKGALVCGTMGLPDHSVWDEDECRDACLEAREMGAEAVVTTEKDAVKMDPSWFALPLLSLRIGLEVQGEADLSYLICGKLLPSESS